jgi:RNA-binding protein
MLTVKEKVSLRGDAMRLKPALKIGRAGFTSGARAQLDALLGQHGLVKVRLDLDDRSARAILATEIAAATVCELVGATGKTAVFFRPRPADEEA